MLHPALVVLWMGAFGVPNPAAAQDDPVLATYQRQGLRYEAAEDAYQAALTARRVIQSDFDAQLDSVRIARASGDQAAFDRASERNMLLARELSRADRRVEATSDSLQVARREYLDAMDARVTALLERQDSATTRDEAQRISALLADLRNQYRELESSSDIFTPQALVLTGVLAYNPTDTPSRLRQKVELATRRIEEMQARIAEADDRIEGIEQRIQLARQSDNFQSSLGRFDDIAVPVGAPGQSRSQGDQAVSDSTGVLTEPQSLEEQLRGWRELRGQLEEMLGSFLRLREELEAHIGADRPRRR